ncbi:MAG TPA: hypothetical protein VFA59_13780 [Vicinamibacterales bacterium]|nr:hypothetical protein [Vicinamibacterales bacterium]
MGRRLRLVVVVALAAARPVSAASAADDPLAKARQLYNQQQFQAAVDAAEKARLTPAHADAADLVAARAYLERFRQSAASDDLTNARLRLRRLDPQHIDPRERVEYVVGLGEALYFDGAYGAAADTFDSVLRGPDSIATAQRERVLDWWADALDKDTRPRPDIDRQAVYRRIRARMDDELSTRPGNGVAAYWRAAAARAQGDLQSAWDAAEAAWVRAPLAVDGGEKLRADLDRLVTKALIPERSRLTGQPAQRLAAEWEQFKERWKK